MDFLSKGLFFDKNEKMESRTHLGRLDFAAKD